MHAQSTTGMEYSMLEPTTAPLTSASSMAQAQQWAGWAQEALTNVCPELLIAVRFDSSPNGDKLHPAQHGEQP